MPDNQEFNYGKYFRMYSIYLHTAYIYRGLNCTCVSTTIRIIFGIVCGRKYTYLLCVVVMKLCCENSNYADRHAATANSKQKGRLNF